MGWRNSADVDTVDVGGIEELRASEVAGDKASVTANVEDCAWVRDGGVDDAVVSKSNEGEVLVVKTGVFCWARGKQLVSKRFQRIWSNGGDYSTGK